MFFVGRFNLWPAFSKFKIWQSFWKRMYPSDLYHWSICVSIVFILKVIKSNFWLQILMGCHVISFWLILSYSWKVTFVVINIFIFLFFNIFQLYFISIQCYCNWINIKLHTLDFLSSWCRIITFDWNFRCTCYEVWGFYTLYVWWVYNRNFN